MRAAVLVPAPDFHEEWNWAYDVEAAALLDGGIAVEPRPWTDVGGFAGIDVVLPLVAWGYHLDHGRWLELLDRLETTRMPTVNPVATLRWNSDKRYLAELHSAGVSTVPTMFVDVLDDAALDAARARFGDHLVVKPPVSASADGTFRLDAAKGVPEPVKGSPMLIQPFMASVTSAGEYSLMFFAGQFSHAIVKRPKAGDYRVQPHLGGSEARCAAPDGAIALALAALAVAPAPPAYARVDMVADASGKLAIMELELIEPALWLQHAPDGGASFAEAIAKAAAR